MRGGAAQPPLIVDLDGTLTPTDTLMESALVLVRKSFWRALMLPLWLVRGRAVLKQELARRVQLDMNGLPWRADFLSYLGEQRAQGRRLILATAAHKDIAESAAAHLGLFDDVLATEGGLNLKGRNKLDAIRRLVGEPFVYAGDSSADLVVWQSASAAVLVGVSAATRSHAERLVPVERDFPAQHMGLRDWASALRVHQWVKNLLVLVPLLTAFSFLDLGHLSHALVAMAAFCLMASGTYLINDMVDIPNDRRHPRKRLRMLASGRMNIPQAVLATIGLLAFGLLLGLSVSIAFAGMMLLYLIMTLSYSLLLKRYVLLDVLSLAALYTVRIVAGSVAIGVSLSTWLLAFSMFLFFCLALVKRCAELMTLKASGRMATTGRDYMVQDLTVLWPMGVASAVGATLVMGLFIQAPETIARFNLPELLWLTMPCLMYWLGRLWIKTSRGEMHDDPVVFALKDRGSRYTVLAVLMVFLLARFWSKGWAL
ncbi:UbiA family prenyltransferase [Paucibacter sp. B2R-40]|uniref:UbiA family prenyltransferase n=1 Tax=Paucibacter sp. B2R-40 TaxID=2893554 RepID=UPI0021E463CF|nr:UbiA family prenyltransferase [Paucibacter sp. B2R-40]MCV2356931.1 UbiA family prenyltransferase [Paucibacter sp. B2R-40]